MNRRAAQPVVECTRWWRLCVAPPEGPVDATPVGVVPGVLTCWVGVGGGVVIRVACSCFCCSSRSSRCCLWNAPCTPMAAQITTATRTPTTNAGQAR